MVMEELKEIQLGVLQLRVEEKNIPLYTGVSWEVKGCPLLATRSLNASPKYPFPLPSPVPS